MNSIKIKKNSKNWWKQDWDVQFFFQFHFPLSYCIFIHALRKEPHPHTHPLSAPPCKVVLVLNSELLCLCFPSAEIKGVHYHSKVQNLNNQFQFHSNSYL